MITNAILVAPIPGTDHFLKGTIMKQLDIAVAQLPLDSNDDATLRLPKDAKQDLVGLNDEQLLLIGGGEGVACW